MTIVDCDYTGETDAAPAINAALASAEKPRFQVFYPSGWIDRFVLFPVGWCFTWRSHYEERFYR